MSKRLLWSFLASVVVNVFAWVVFTKHTNTGIAGDIDREAVISIEHRTSIRKEPRRESIAQSLATSAVLAVPVEWRREGLVPINAPPVTLWLDWKKQTADFVPRIFLWQKTADSAGRHRRPSLHDAVREVLGSLSTQDIVLERSSAQRVCRGHSDGWFLSYAKMWDEPPLHFEETILIDGETIYRATYIRPVDAPEDRAARDALMTLCV